MEIVLVLQNYFTRICPRNSIPTLSVQQCMDACQLQPDGTKGTRFLENVKLVDFRDVSAYIRNILPRYFSQFMVGVVQNYARQHYRNVINENGNILLLPILALRTGNALVYLAITTF